MENVIETGEYVEVSHKAMLRFIKNHGEAAFNTAVYHGAWQDIAFRYIHPEEDLEKLEGFQLIQSAFIAAYV